MSDLTQYLKGTRQRLGLRKEIGEENAVVRAEWIVRVGRGRDELGALV